MVNRKNLFPNFREVLKNLDYCNKKYNFGLSKDQQSRVAQDAFEKLGKVLQERRRTDLYETTTFYVGKAKDPAKEDPELRIRLEKNKKNYAKYDDIINEYAKKEEKALSDDAEEVSSTSKLVDEIETVKDDSVEELPVVDASDLLATLPGICDKNGATDFSLDDDDEDVMILS